MMVFLGIKSRKIVKMGSNHVKQAYEHGAGSHAKRHLPQSCMPCRLDRGHGKTHDGSCKHHAGTISQENIVPLVWYLFDYKAQSRAKQRCGAQCERTCYNGMYHECFCTFKI